MRCLCGTDMIETTDMDSGKFRWFICPKCSTNMEINRNTLEAYVQTDSPHADIGDTLRTFIRDVVREEMKAR